MNAPPGIAVLIPAAGAGRRMGGSGSKVLAPLAGEPLIRHTVRLFHALPAIEAIHVICRPAERAALQACFAHREAWAKLRPLIEGGAERRDSVFRGLHALESRPPWAVLVHDGARPCCSPALVARLLAALETAEAAVPVIPLADTVRRRAEGRSEVVDRAALLRTQTPQAFRWATLHEAYRCGMTLPNAFTDDAQFVEAAGGAVATVPGEARNIKVTHGDDLALAAWLLQHPHWGLGADP
ncbi:MAG: 2-C-methyl-D-erythritol 4-phosphate cytidylyltransferase [Candidatus Lambdaproteobacteria bacterium]|nr:2-C-methyl-D-erythritol 4-phosphate cytidylyltransferase [Candidatus Lambdaproteobacteria bacterium]